MRHVLQCVIVVRIRLVLKLNLAPHYSTLQVAAVLHLNVGSRRIYSGRNLRAVAYLHLVHFLVPFQASGQHKYQRRRWKVSKISAVVRGRVLDFKVTG